VPVVLASSLYLNTHRIKDKAMSEVLIDSRDNSILDIVPNGADFPVHPTLVWVRDNTGNVKAGTHNYNGNAFTRKPPHVPVPVPVDPTPGTIDVIQYMIDEGITTRAAAVAKHPEWEPLLP